MEYRLLGPIEVVTADTALEIRSARQRIALSMLLFHPNQAVPVEALVDAIWDASPPATARSQVQTCISALRRELGKAGAGDVIATHPAGYAIRVRDGELDVGIFEHLVSRGRAAAADNRGSDAAVDLRKALSLWRGAAGAGVDSKLIQAVATRLNETRLSVTEDCIEIELGLGLHHQLTGELSELVRRHPLRERMRALHMLALYRSARQAEALESFQEIRQILGNELGLGPGAELAALQHAILANDHSLALEPGLSGPLWRTAHGARSAPHQLPAAAADFTGREDVLKTLAEVLTPLGRDGDLAGYVPVVTITGKGGVGKTALALRCAHAARPYYPDGQLFAQLRDAAGDPVSSHEVLAAFLRALGLAPAALPAGHGERATLYRSFLGNRRILIVLDDAETASQVTPLIPGSPNSAVIVTSRRPLTTLPGAAEFEIDDLDEQASIALLGRVIGRERIRAEQPSAEALVRLCGGLPLALRIVAAKLAARGHWRLDQMVGRMTDEGKRLDELALSGIGVRATLSVSFESLGRDARRLFARLGLLGTADFAAWISAPLLDAQADDAVDVLDMLVEARLVEVRVREDGSARFRLHDLVRLYALERLAAEPAADRAAALERLLACWLALASEAHRRTYGGDFAVLHGSAPGWPLPDRHVDRLLAKPLRWLREEQAGLVWAVLTAGQAGLDEMCWDLAMTSVTLFESEYQSDDWRKTHEVALAVARQAGNLRGEAAMLYSLGNLAVGERLGDAPRYLDPALALFRQLGDLHGTALTLAILAFADRLSGRSQRSLERYREALAGFRSAGDRVGEVDALTNLAQIHLDRGEYRDVQRLLDEALVLCRTLRARRIVAQTEHRLGEFFLRRGELERAELSFRSVLQAVRQEGDLVGEAYALHGLGMVRTRQQEYALAKSDLEAALDLSRHVGDNLVRGRVLLACAELYLARKEPQTAGPLLNEALVVFSEIGPAAIWRARFLELKARLDELAGRGAEAQPQGGPG